MRVLFIMVFLLVGCGSSDSSPDDVQTADSPAEAGGSDAPMDGAAGDHLSETDQGVGPSIVEPHAEQRGDFTVIWLAGSPYEMGYQQGELLHDTIAEAMEFVKGDVTLAAIPLLARDMGLIDLAMDNSYQDVLDECQGLVDATVDTGFNMDYCLVLNFGDVLLEFLGTGGPGCTSVIAAGQASEDQVLRHARNLDWGSMNIDIIHQHPVIQVRQPEDGFAHVYVGFPLNLSPYTGMNEAGISIGSHEADPAGAWEESNTGRSHVQMVGQLLKKASSLDEARAFLQGEKHMSAEILTIGDGNNKIGGVFEMTATGIGERSFAEDLLFATNHFEHPDMVPKGDDKSTSSDYRWLRLEQLLLKAGQDSVWGTISAPVLADVMQDIVHPLTGQEPDPVQLEAMGWDNDASIGANGPMHFAIFEPASGLFWVAAGTLPLHLQPYHCFSLGELLGRPDPIPCEPATL